MTRSAGLAAVKRGYTDGTRRLASRWITGLARTRVTPNALTTAGITLCAVAGVLVWFGDHNPWLIYWTAAVVFVVGSVLDILDGALARHGGKATPFGAFLDSISDRVSEGFVLTACALVFSRHGNEVAVAFAIAAMAGSFLVSYARAKAESLGFSANVGIAERAERLVSVLVVTGLTGLGLPPVVLLVTLVLLAGASLSTVVQRVISVRRQALAEPTPAD